MTRYKGRLRSKTFKRAFPHIVEVAVLKKRPMCGRFTNRLTWREIVALYQLTAPATPERNLPARYNICPTTTIDAVIERESKRELVPMRWGLVPSWWKKKAKETPSTFNARAETVAEKPMFRSAFKRNRCLIPASGYYEWLTTPTGKQPYYYTARDSSPLTVAGLWDEWKDIETGEPLKSSLPYIGGRWYAFDPRNNVPRIGRILMARGRDATDVAIVTSFGPCTLAGFKVITDEVTSAAPMST